MPTGRRKRKSVVSKAAELLRAAGMKRGSSILVGVSGGSDSTALFLILEELSAVWNFRLAVAHLDHALRGPEEAEAERRHVEALCRRCDRDLHYRRLEPGAIRGLAASKRLSPEEAARKERYAFFREALDRTDSSYLALGHTRDDLVETLVMRFFQGSGLEGLGGLETLRGFRLRPLLSSNKAELEAWLRSRGETWCVDSTNADERLLRNAVRSRVLPSLKTVFPGLEGSLSEYASKMRRIRVFLNEEARTRLPWTSDGDGRCFIPASVFFTAPPALREISLYQAYDRLEVGRFRLPARFLRRLIEADNGASAALPLEGYGTRLWLENDCLIWKREEGSGCPRG